MEKKSIRANAVGMEWHTNARVTYCLVSSKMEFKQLCARLNIVSRYYEMILYDCRCCCRCYLLHTAFYNSRLVFCFSTFLFFSFRFMLYTDLSTFDSIYFVYALNSIILFLLDLFVHVHVNAARKSS